MFYVICLLLAGFTSECVSKQTVFTYIGTTNGQYLSEILEINLLKCVRACMETGTDGCKASSFNFNENMCMLLVTLNSSLPENRTNSSGKNFGWETFKMAQCIDGWLKWKGSCYKMYTEVANWTVARQSCRNVGAHVTSIEDSEEAKFVWQKVARAQTSGNVFLGGRDIEEEAVWRWVDDDDDIQNDILMPMDITNSEWKPAEPSNTGEEDCLVVEFEGTWNDVKCSNEFPYICEYSL